MEALRIGVLGWGPKVSKLGMMFARVGHEVVFDEGWNRQKSEALVRRAGGRSRVGPANQADILLTDLPTSRLVHALSGAGTLETRVLFSCLPTSMTARLASVMPPGSLVSAFGALDSEEFCPIFSARGCVAPPPVDLHGGNEVAKAVVKQLVLDVGFLPLDKGALHEEPAPPAAGGLTADFVYHPDGTVETVYRFERRVN